MKEKLPLTSSFRLAFAGLVHVTKSQRNMKIHLFIASVVILFGMFFRLSAWEWGLVLLAIALVTFGEVMNTALEALVDLASPEYHPLAARAKDIAAGGVLLTAMFSVIIAVVVFGPRLFKLITRVFL